MLSSPLSQTTISTGLPAEHFVHLHVPHPHFDRHALASFLSNVMMHTFAPATCQACTCSASSTTTHHENEAESPSQRPTEAHIIVDDEFVLIEEDENDGGPLCREREIEAWKSEPGCKKVMLGQRKRRLSMRCFGEE